MKKSIVLLWALILICVCPMPVFAQGMNNVILDNDDAALFFGTVLEYDRNFEERFVAMYEDSSGTRITKSSVYAGYIEIEVKTVFKGDLNLMNRELETYLLRYEYTDDSGIQTYGPELYGVTYQIGEVITSDDGKTVIKTKAVNDFVPEGMQAGETYLFAFYGDLTGMKTTSEDPRTLKIINAGDYESIESNLHEGRYEIAEQERIDRLNMGTDTYFETVPEENYLQPQATETEAFTTEGTVSGTGTEYTAGTLPVESASRDSNQTETLPYENVETFETTHIEAVPAVPIIKKAEIRLEFVVAGVIMSAIIATCAVLLLKKK